MSIFKMFDKKTNQSGVVKTSAEQLRDIIWQHKGQYFSVEWVKADGTLRKAVAQVGYKEGYDGDNTVAHIPKYVTVVEKGVDSVNPGKPKFRNVDTTTIKRLAIGGVVLYEQNSLYQN